MDIHRCRFVDYTPHIITASAFSHPSDTSKVAPPGLRLAVGRSNGDIEIWNPRYNWSHELTLPGGRGRTVEGLVWSYKHGENPRLFSIGGSTYITEWDLKTCRPLANLNCNAGVIWCIDSNQSGTRLAVGCDDGSVAVIDISGGRGVMEFEFICQRQDQRVLGLRWFGDDKLIGGCADGRVRCWGITPGSRGQLLSSMKVDKSKTESTLVWSIVSLPSKNQFVTGDSTGSVKFWDITNFSLIQSFFVHEADVLSLSRDFAGDMVFSAGIDRKIHQYSCVEMKKKGNSKWIHNSNRLLHSNDVRTLSLFESKAYNFLVSGGVERSIIVQSVENFQHGTYKKILVSQQISNIVVEPQSNLIALFQDQTIKIWRLLDDKYRLVAKISLSEEDNVTSISIGAPIDSSSLLAVATINSVKLFRLADAEQKLKVKKLRSSNFDSLMSGAKSVALHGHNKLLVQTPEDEIYRFSINDDNIELDDEIELNLDEGNVLRAGYDHFNSIQGIAVSNDGSKLAVARFNSAITIVPLDAIGTGKTLATLANDVHLMTFTERNTLVVLTEDNKLFEFNTKASNTDLLTAWSERNSEVMPITFLRLEQKPEGIFSQNGKIWIYGVQWLAYFDLKLNLDVTKNYTSKSKKRNNDGLSILEAESIDGKTTSTSYFETEMTAAQIRRLEQEDEDSDSEEKKKSSFWLTQKYRPILKVASWGENDIAVIEREAFALPTSSAFEAPLLKI